MEAHSPALQWQGERIDVGRAMFTPGHGRSAANAACHPARPQRGWRRMVRDSLRSPRCLQADNHHEYTGLVAGAYNQAGCASLRITSILGDTKEDLLCCSTCVRVAARASRHKGSGCRIAAALDPSPELLAARRAASRVRTSLGACGRGAGLCTARCARMTTSTPHHLPKRQPSPPAPTPRSGTCVGNAQFPCRADVLGDCPATVRSGSIAWNCIVSGCHGWQPGPLFA